MVKPQNRGSWVIRDKWKKEDPPQSRRFHTEWAESQVVRTEVRPKRKKQMFQNRQFGPNPLAGMGWSQLWPNSVFYVLTKSEIRV